MKDLNVKAELRQGNALFPTLFNVALESVVKGLIDTDVGWGIGLLNKNISLIVYGNNTVLIGKRVEEIKTLAGLLIERINPMGLMVNEEKTKWYYRAKTTTKKAWQWTECFSKAWTFN